jgi:aryl-alcohol dehydrogenase-like predicted oxidoreductase
VRRGRHRAGQAERTHRLRRRPRWKDTDKPTIAAVERIANARGVSMATIASAWVLKHPSSTRPSSESLASTTCLMP